METEMQELRDHRSILLKAMDMVTRGQMSLDMADSLSSLSQQFNNSCAVEIKMISSAPTPTTFTALPEAAE